MDTDSIVISINTKNIIKDLKNLEDLFYFSILNENHELFSDKSKPKLGRFKIETPKNVWIGKFISLRNKMYPLKCGDDSEENLRGSSKSQSKIIKIEEHFACLFGGEY